MRLFPVSATTTLPAGSTATPYGPAKAALVPAPSANPAAPPPASRLTRPPGVTKRTQWLSTSATNTLPPASTATPRGPLKAAAVPTPFAKPAPAAPARVDTTRAGLTARMRLFAASPTNRVPALSTQTPEGAWNAALVPIPSVAPAAAPPASVNTSPAGVTRRAMLLPWSATTTLPLRSKATPRAPLKEVGPSTKAPAPPPTRVVTTPAGVTLRMRPLPPSATAAKPLPSTATLKGQ